MARQLVQQQARSAGFPRLLQVGDECADDEQVDRALAENLIGEVDLAAARETNFRDRDALGVASACVAGSGCTPAPVTSASRQRSNCSSAAAVRPAAACRRMS
jgi:hypothetical protein